MNYGLMGAISGGCLGFGVLSVFLAPWPLKLFGLLIVPGLILVAKFGFVKEKSEKERKQE